MVADGYPEHLYHSPDVNAGCIFRYVMETYVTFIEGTWIKLIE